MRIDGESPSPRRSGPFQPRPAQFSAPFLGAPSPRFSHGADVNRGGTDVNRGVANVNCDGIDINRGGADVNPQLITYFPMNSVKLPGISGKDSRNYSDYMFSQITGSLTEFARNFRKLNLAILTHNQVDSLRIADYIDILKFR